MNALLAPIAAAALIAWAAIIRHGGLLAGCLITLAAGTVLGYDLFHVGSITSDRLLLILLVATYLVARTLGQTSTFELSRTDIVFGAFIGFLTVSTLTNNWRWDENYPLSRLLFYAMLPAAIYWVARQSRQSDAAFKWAFASVGLFGVYLSITAIAETRDWYGLIFPKYIVNSPTTEFLGRGRGPLLNPVGNGLLISIALLCVMMLWPHVRKFGRAVIVATCLLLLAGAYCTLTRSVWIGAAGCVGIVGLLTLDIRTRRMFIVASILGGTIVLPVAYQASKAFKRDKNVSVADMEGSASLRPIFARVAWLMFKEQPLAGVGYGHYMEQHKNYLQDRETNLRLNLALPYQQHNLWLSLLVETGLIGVSLFTAAFLCWFRAGWQLWHARSAPLVARQIGLMQIAMTFAFFANGMFHELAIIPMVNMCFFCLSGLTVGLWLRYAVPSAKQVPVRVLPGIKLPSSSTSAAH